METQFAFNIMYLLNFFDSHIINCYNNHMRIEAGEYLITIAKPLLEDQWPGCIEEVWTKDGVPARPDGLPTSVYRSLVTGEEVYKRFPIYCGPDQRD